MSKPLTLTKAECREAADLVRALHDEVEKNGPLINTREAGSANRMRELVLNKNISLLVDALSSSELSFFMGFFCGWRVAKGVKPPQVPM